MCIQINELFPNATVFTVLMMAFSSSMGHMLLYFYDKSDKQYKFLSITMFIIYALTSLVVITFSSQDYRFIKYMLLIFTVVYISAFYCFSNNLFNYNKYIPSKVLKYAGYIFLLAGLIVILYGVFICK